MFVTNTCSGDGFGSQFQFLLSLILISLTRGDTFLYTPLNRIHHNYDNNPVFIQKLEGFMNIYSRFQLIRSVSVYRRSRVRIMENAEVKKMFDRDIDSFTSPENLAFVREMFWANKTRLKRPYDDPFFRVAVHIRRLNRYDDLYHYGQSAYDERFSDKHYYLRIMNHIRETYADRNDPRPLRFHIYAQSAVLDRDHGGNSDTDEDLVAFFGEEDVIYHIDTDMCDTFLDMVRADALVTSASSFSYTAALLSEGEIFYRPFWHRPLATWRVMETATETAAETVA